jgi:Tfp pilus assembly protein PilF
MAGIITTVKITGSNALRTTAKQLSLGEKYLSELKYDKAIVAFNKVIEIEPRNMQAYLGHHFATSIKNLDICFSLIPRSPDISCLLK